MLTYSEKIIVETLEKMAGLVATKRMFFDALYPVGDVRGIKILDVLVCRARTEYKNIQSMWGRGYYLASLPDNPIPRWTIARKWDFIRQVKAGAFKEDLAEQMAKMRMSKVEFDEWYEAISPRKLLTSANHNFTRAK